MQTMIPSAPGPQADADTATSGPSLGRRRLFAALAVVLALALGLAAAEAMTRLLRPYYTVEDLRNQSLLYQGSIFSQHVLLRQARRVRDIPHPDSMAVEINSLGYRGREFSPKKPPGVRRIVFLGGSAVFGFGLRGLDADWPSRVARRLRNAGLGDVECINAGVPGHATFDSLGRIVGEIHLFEPDWLVLYQCHNDLKYFTWVAPDNSLLSALAPYRQQDDPRITYQGWLDRLLCHSQLYTKVRTAWFDRRVRTWQTGGYGRMPPRPPTPYGIRQYRLDVELICDAANNLNAKAMLVTQAHLTSDLRDKAPWEALRMDEAAFLKCHDECADALRDVALRKGAELVDASAQMSGKAEYFIDVVHLTPEGAERLAELVAARLGPLLRAGRP